MKTSQTVQTESQNGADDPEKHGSSIRETDPNVLQGKASDPNSSVWVGASAGTGKTKVLTDRVLRLLLPESESRAGTPAHKILCLTFTKAAASEMALRINKTLAAWAVMDEPELSETLQKLLRRAPCDYELDAARQLFAQVIDTAGGLKIMTLHSFCQSILGRFPLEAGITPNFTVLDEQGSRELMEQARSQVYKHASQSASSPLSHALHNLASTINEDQFRSLLMELSKERGQLQRLLGKTWNIDGLYTNICATLGIVAGQTAKDIILTHCQEENFAAADLREAGRVLYESKRVTDNEKADKILNWLNADLKTRLTTIDTYKSALIKPSDGLPYATMMSKTPSEQYPGLLEAMKNEAERLLDLQEKINKAHCAALTRDLILLGGEIIQNYASLKAKNGVLDFDDLITLTTTLLSGGRENTHALDLMPSWVLYKLDQGLDHILIDEAQDTNPEQWTIIKALAEEFFAGIGTKDDTLRTIFTVGDEKQSIYSFQRASPEEFDIMRTHFNARIKDAALQWDNVNLNTSFRSTRSILEAVDLVFGQQGLNLDPGFSDIKHISARDGQAGLVELWPLFESESVSESDPWDPPINITEARSGANLCAETIANTIQGWLDKGEILESHDRPIQAGDIMILVRTRTAFVNQLIRALKTRNIPVAGHDRMVLNEQLAVQDLMALVEFSLLPSDDLTLACLLKSPLIGLTEEALYNLAVDRKTSLWDAFRHDESLKESKDYLESFINAAHHMHPFEFLSAALARPCPADNISGLRAIKKRLGHDALDPLDELLNAALRYEEDHTPSLQGFIGWQKSGQAQIKREMEESGGQVRIMTVHGSKGLQAPIVIMPDTTRNNRNVPGQADKRLLWPHKTGLNVPLWSPRKDMNFELFKEAYNIIEAKDDQEYRRLLYVAMTRAEERLYVTGYKGKNEPIEDSWYNYIKSALKHSPSVHTLESGILRLSNKRERAPDKASKNIIATDHSAQNLPAWLFKSAPAEPSPPQPLVPSRPSESEPAALSPLQASDQSRFRRGNVTHKLLQFLPDIAADLREPTARKFLARYAQDLNETIRENIIKECIQIMNTSEFAPLFGPGSRAEVPITGLINTHELISGQIDRLYIDDDNIWIIDFKTNRPPPQDIKDVPAIYKSQMRAYHDTLRTIYPHHRIHCALLWTDGPLLMPIEI